MSVEDVQRALAAVVHENNELRAALGRVATLVDRLEQRGCISCSSLTGGDFIAEELREALGEAFAPATISDLDNAPVGTRIPLNTQETP